MILVDTSVWVDLLRKRPRRMIAGDDLIGFATCGPIVQEVLQGLKPGVLSEEFRQSFIAVPVLSDPIPLSLFEAAAEIFRQGRQRGYTVRSSMDCLIAAIAIANRVPVWHRDRDFEVIGRYTPLKMFRSS